MESDWPVPDCRGGLSSLSPLPSFQSVAVLVGVSLWAVWTSVLCLCLFRFCSAATVYKVCAWLQLTAGPSEVLLVQFLSFGLLVDVSPLSRQVFVWPWPVFCFQTRGRVQR